MAETETSPLDLEALVGRLREVNSDTRAIRAAEVAVQVEQMRLKSPERFAGWVLEIESPVGAALMFRELVRGGLN